ncbi:MAG: tryptophan--tRNA ligase [Tissierellia bacterium]|nr:tryptophan--tRNA ligase [Tissierellia bacterium]
MKKGKVFSGVQPSGALTIGNYIGALRNFVGLQDEFDCYYCIVDLHAITVPQIPKNLRKRTLDVLALYIASGIDPEKSTLFIQSHVPAHSELSWVLSTITYMGQLNRMTQYKEKAKKSEENLNAGLFTYPVLMASDILLYQADFVPVGDDQKQHLELARDLAERFNNRYSETFKVPEPLISEFGARIMSLQNPESKMSKSDDDENAYILLLDDSDTINRKIKRAVTDSIGEIRYCDEQPGLKNLLNIYSVFSNEDVESLVKKYDGIGYGKFKEDLSEVVIEGLKPIQEKYLQLTNSKDYLEDVYKKGAEKAAYVSGKTLRKVYKKIGFIPK